MVDRTPVRVPQGGAPGRTAEPGEPRAAILVLYLAMAAANAVAEIRAVLGAAHPGEDPETLSGYYLAEEIAETRRAIELFLPDSV